MSTTADGIWVRLAETRPAPRGLRPSGLWRRLARRLDPAALRPGIADDVEVKEFQLRWGNDYAMIRNPRDLIHYRLEPEELALVRLMDGTRTLKDIVVERFRESGGLELDAVAELVSDLHKGGFLEESYVDVNRALDRAQHPSIVARKGREFLRTLSIDWSEADRLVRWLYHHGFRVFFTAPAVILGSILGVAGLGAFLLIVREGHFSLTGRSLALEFLILMVLNYVLTFLHELGHALVIVHYGRTVKSAGFMIYFGSPAFFVEASDALMLDRRQRIVQAFAGPFAELMVAGVASLIALLYPDAAISSVLYKFAVLNYFVLFMNLIPLLELDGYWILSDLIQVPNLRPRSLAFVREQMWTKLRTRERWNRVEVGLALYGIVGVAFAVFSLYTGFFFWQEIFGGLILDMWEGSSFTRLLLVILAALVAGPLIRGLIALLRAGWRRIRGAWNEIRFRLERGWRVEAAMSIDSLPLFADLPEQTLNEVAGRVRLRALPAGHALFRQGDRPDAFYVVRRGTLHVVEEDPDTEAERVLRTLGPGDALGELGLLEGAPRSATVRAVEDAELFVVDKGAFDELLADEAVAPQFAPGLQRAAELRAMPVFRHLSSSELLELAGIGSWINVTPGEDVVSEGEPGDAFYSIGSGRLEVIRGGQRVETLGPGGWFGEVALLLDIPRTATVRAVTPARLFRLPREGFDRLVAESFRRGRLTPATSATRSQRH